MARYHLYRMDEDQMTPTKVMLAGIATANNTAKLNGNQFLEFLLNIVGESVNKLLNKGDTGETFERLRSIHERLRKYHGWMQQTQIFMKDLPNAKDVFTLISKLIPSNYIICDDTTDKKQYTLRHFFQELMYNPTITSYNAYTWQLSGGYAFIHWTESI